MQCQALLKCDYELFRIRRPGMVAECQACGHRFGPGQELDPLFLVLVHRHDRDGGCRFDEEVRCKWDVKLSLLRGGNLYNVVLEASPGCAQATITVTPAQQEGSKASSEKQAKTKKRNNNNKRRARKQRERILATAAQMDDDQPMGELLEALSQEEPQRKQPILDFIERYHAVLRLRDEQKRKAELEKLADQLALAARQLETTSSSSSEPVAVTPTTYSLMGEEPSQQELAPLVKEDSTSQDEARHKNVAGHHHHIPLKLQRLK
jgi:hypothetical protein